MKESNLKSGRVNQKLQTRLEILKAAKDLMHEEKKITLEVVAKQANISRATMYRYFSNIDLLIMEASLDFHHKSSDQIFEEVKDLPFEERVLQIQKHYNQLAQENEIVFRRYISAVLSESITSNESLRGARRVTSLKKALEPFKGKLNEDTFNKLINISSVLMGIDPLITSKDVCKLDNTEADETLQWGLKMILKGIAAEQNEEK